jgi:hypothetical protein
LVLLSPPAIVYNKDIRVAKGTIHEIINMDQKENIEIETQAVWTVRRMRRLGQEMECVYLVKYGAVN